MKTELVYSIYLEFNDEWIKKFPEKSGEQYYKSCNNLSDAVEWDYVLMRDWNYKLKKVIIKKEITEVIK